MNAAVDALARNERSITTRSVELALGRMPEYAARLDAAGRRRCEEDAGFHVRFLLSALLVEDEAIFTDYARWVRELLARYGIPASALVVFFDAIADAVAAEAPDAAPATRPYLAAGADAVAG